MDHNGIGFTIKSDATGELFKGYAASEEMMQRHFRRMLATAAAYTDTREVPTEVPDPENEGQTKTVMVTESFQRPRTLGECLLDLVNSIAAAEDAKTLEWERSEALKEAQAKIQPIGFEAK